MSLYSVIYEKGPNGWGAYAPDLPGLGAAAPTLEEVKELIREGIESHIECLLEERQPVPEPTTLVGTVEMDLVKQTPQQFAKSA